MKKSVYWSKNEIRTAIDYRTGDRLLAISFDSRFDFQGPEGFEFPRQVIKEYILEEMEKRIDAFYKEIVLT